MTQWFKFYGADYLIDPKVKCLTASQRSCLVTLLCHASVSEIPGEIRYLREFQLMVDAGLDPTEDEWGRTTGILNKLVELGVVMIDDNGVITVLNYRKRQDTALTNYERVKKFREKKRFDNEDVTEETEVKQNDNTRVEEKRVEENRREKNINTRGDTSPTPAQKAQDFFTNEQKRRELGVSIAEKYNADIKVIAEEVRKFTAYWKEKNKSGTKEKWQLQQTFEVNLRLENWLRKYPQFNKTNQTKQRKIWKQPSQQTP